jgi:hypothetical protein
MQHDKYVKQEIRQGVLLGTHYLSNYVFENISFYDVLANLIHKHRF